MPAGKLSALGPATGVLNSSRPAEPGKVPSPTKKRSGLFAIISSPQKPQSRCDPADFQGEVYCVRPFRSAQTPRKQGARQKRAAKNSKKQKAAPCFVCSSPPGAGANLCSSKFRGTRRQIPRHLPRVEWVGGRTQTYGTQQLPVTSSDRPNRIDRPLRCSCVVA